MKHVVTQTTNSMRDRAVHLMAVAVHIRTNESDLFHRLLVFGYHVSATSASTPQNATHSIILVTIHEYGTRRVGVFLSAHPRTEVRHPAFAQCYHELILR